ncbi:MAG: pyrroline-5-carboxylate reductase [Clostridia bacterium]|nr:pyrroline-5-carboxylate reductase [Clostridia bacterium]
MKYKLGVIGAGFMSTAIINGVISSKIINSNQIIVSDVNACALEIMAQKGVDTTQCNFDLVNESEFVLFAIKPQNLNSVLDEIKDSAKSNQKFISIMAGVKKEKIKKVINGALVARCMPNTPCAIGCGAIGIDSSDFVQKDDVDFVNSLFSSLASFVNLSEDKMNAVTGVSGSAPAYFYLFLKYIIDAGVKNGLDYEDAKLLATNTMIGAGRMVLANPEKTIEQLIDAVCSKGGTTIEAVKVFKDNCLKDITEKAIDACVNRSFELENL